MRRPDARIERADATRARALSPARLRLRRCCRGRRCPWPARPARAAPRRSPALPLENAPRPSHASTSSAGMGSSIHSARRGDSRSVRADATSTQSDALSSAAPARAKATRPPLSLAAPAPASTRPSAKITRRAGRDSRESRFRSPSGLLDGCAEGAGITSSTGGRALAEAGATRGGGGASDRRQRARPRAWGDGSRAARAGARRAARPDRRGARGAGGSAPFQAGS
jgi:hypothetical protein